MNKIELFLRSLARRTGLAGPIYRFLMRHEDRRKQELLREWERTKASTVRIEYERHALTMKVTNAEEYAHYKCGLEPGTTRAVLNAIRPGDVVWDVGANVGLFSLLMADACGEKGRVLAFEPLPSCLDRLHENAALNPKLGVTAMGVALSNSGGKTQISVASGGLEGDIRLVEYQTSGKGEQIFDIEKVRGDDLVASGRAPVPNFIKVDVQGAEEDVLVGLTKTLREPACRALVIEIHFHIFASLNNTEAPLRIENLLKASGFRIERIDRNHIGAYK